MSDGKKTYTQEEVDAIIGKTVEETVSKMGAAASGEKQEGQKPSFLKGFLTLNNAITGIVAAGLTAAGMYYFTGSDEEIAE